PPTADSTRVWPAALLISWIIDQALRYEMPTDLAAAVMLRRRPMASSNSARPSPRIARPSRSIHRRTPTVQSRLQAASDLIDFLAIFPALDSVVPIPKIVYTNSLCLSLHNGQEEADHVPASQRFYFAGSLSGGHRDRCPDRSTLARSSGKS